MVFAVGNAAMLLSAGGRPRAHYRSERCTGAIVSFCVYAARYSELEGSLRQGGAFCGSVESVD